MKLISIEKQHAKEGENVIVNTANICSLFMDKGVVVVRMACGWGLYSKFTSVSSAADYILKASYNNSMVSEISNDHQER